MPAISRLAAIAMVVWTAVAGLAQAQDQMPWQPNIETAQQIAAQTNRLVLLHFWSESCQPCKRLDREVFSSAEVARALEPNFVMVKLNVEDSPGTARLYGVSSIPTDVIILPNGRLVSQTQSPPSANQFVTQMNQAAAGHRELVRRSMGQTQAAASPPAGPPTAPPVASQGPRPGAAPPMQTGFANDRYAEYFPQQTANRVAAGAPAGYPPPQAQRPPQMAAAAPPVQQAQMQQPQMPPPAQVAQQQPPMQQTSMQQTAMQQPPQAPAPYANQQAAMGQGPAPRLPAPPQLPQGSPPLGLEGYCPVTLVERQQWAMGTATYGAVHRGRTYLFLGPNEVKKFLANPDLYSPVLSGNDPVLALDNQVAVPGRREFGVYADNRVYLFANEDSRIRFEQNPKRYAAETLQAMR